MENKSHGQDASVSEKSCPHCGKHIPAAAKKCPYCQSDLRRWSARHPILLAALLILGFGIVLSSLGAANRQSTSGTSFDTNPPPAPTVTAPAKAAPVVTAKPKTPSADSAQNTTPPAPAATWHTVATFSGITQKNTSPFTIKGSQWRITWQESGDGYFGADADSPNGSGDYCAIANLSGSGSDSTYCYGSGTYYISVNTANPWSMTVEDYY